MLLESFRMKGLFLKNRVVAAPLSTCSCGMDGTPTEKTFAFYAKIAKSAPGLVVMEHHAVHPWGRNRLEQLRLDSNSAALSLAPLVRLFRDEGVPVLAQLNFSGGRAKDPALLSESDFRLVSSSSIVTPNATFNATPDALTPSEIENIIEHFACAAERAVRIAGYSGVQVHASHGYLIGQFLSRLTNKRSDAWGGSVKKRSRFLLAVVEAIRHKLPASSLLTVRLGVADHMPDEPVYGLTVDDVLPVARELSLLGVDCIHVSGNHCGFGGDKARKGAYFSPYAKAVRDSVGDKVVVECTGGIRTPQVARQLLRRGVCDLVGIGRPLYKEQGYLNGWGLS